MVTTLWTIGITAWFACGLLAAWRMQTADTMVYQRSTDPVKQSYWFRKEPAWRRWIVFVLMCVFGIGSLCFFVPFAQATIRTMRQRPRVRF